MQTFTDSQQFLAYMQARYGSANWSKWQSLRKQFYSYVQYPAAGGSIFNFFGTAVGGVGAAGNAQFTNMPKAGSFGQNHFLLKALRAKYFIADQKINQFDGTNASTFTSEMLSGVFQAGEFELSIGSRVELQLPNPFLYMPPSDGRSQVYQAGIKSTTFPPTPLTQVSRAPFADLDSRSESSYVVDPNILIEAEQNFQAIIQFPAGSVPVISTGVVNDNTNPLYIGIEFDGLIFRPQQ